MATKYEPDTPRNRGLSDAPHVSPVTPEEDIRTVVLNEVSWGAILVGVAIALVTQLLLNLLGVGVGVATLDPGTADNPDATSFSIAAGIWWVLSGVIAALVGGYAAGRLCGRPKESTAGWHGVAAWATTTLVIFYLLTSTLGAVAGGLYSTVMGTVGAAGGAATQAAGAQAQSGVNPFAAIEAEIREAAGGDTQAAQDAAVAAMQALVTGNEAEAEAARTKAADAIAQAQGISPEEARKRVDQYEQKYRAQATDVAEGATTAVSTGAIVAFIALLLGGIASWFGGRAGAVYPTLTAFVPMRRRD